MTPTGRTFSRHTNDVRNLTRKVKEVYRTLTVEEREIMLRQIEGSTHTTDKANLPNLITAIKSNYPRLNDYEYARYERGLLIYGMVSAYTGR